MFIFNNHKNLEGLHAFMGASQNSWLNWSKEVTVERWLNSYSQAMGTALHEFAKDCINSRMKLSMDDRHLIEYVLYKASIPKEAYDANKILLNLVPYVNDAIGYGGKPEVLLYYSEFCFGTTDYILWDPIKKILRIFDYKSGNVKARLEQLRVYTSLFCLEYRVDPFTIKELDLRIYQNGDYYTEETTPDMIKAIMDIIIEKNTIITAVAERNNK